MARSTRRNPPKPDAQGILDTPNSIAGRLLATVAVVSSALVVFQGSLAYFFSQDDFAGLARATGLLPRLEGPWRWLSHQAYFDAFHAWFGLNPWPYHLANLVVHAACSLLLLTYLRRWTSLPAAAVGAVFFASHPANFTAVYWIAAIGDSMALAFGLCAILLCSRRDGWRLLSIPAFACSLLSKESTLLLPFLLLISQTPDTRDTRSGASGPRDPLTLSLIAMALVYMAWLVTPGGSGTPAATEHNQPYAVALDAHAWFNFLTYAGWSVNLPAPLVRGFTDSIDSLVTPWGVGLLVVWSLGCGIRSLRARGWVIAGVYFLLLITPALPLRNHTYHYYAYAALPGVAWMCAAILDALSQAGRATRYSTKESPAQTVTLHVRQQLQRLLIPGCAGFLVGLLTINGASLVQKIELTPLGNGPLRSDPTVDRALVVARVAAGVRRTPLPAGERLWFWSPARLAAGLPADAPDNYWERNVRAATLDGLAVRVLFPLVAEVRFVRELQPPPGNTRYAIFGVDGRTDVFTWDAIDSATRTQP